MRRISERTVDEWRDAVAPEGGGAAALSVRHSHPEWVVAALRAALLGHGRATPATVDAELEALLEADNDPPRVHLVARPGLATVDDLLDGVDAEPSRLSPIGAVLHSGDPGAVAAVRDGRAAVQDDGSQLVALALARAEVGPDVPARWLDLCAGPGGKAGVLGALAVERGADLTAVEVSPHRADLVRSTLGALIRHARGLGRTVEVRTADGREVGEDDPAAYARVLVDAPCTGLGALRRRPEARWRRQPSDVAGLAPLQRALLGVRAGCRRAGWRRRVRHVQPARRRDPVRRVRRREEAARRRGRRRPAAVHRRRRAAGRRAGGRPVRPALAARARLRRDVLRAAEEGDLRVPPDGRLVWRSPGPGDAEAIGRMHHRAWQDTYTDLLPDDWFERYTVDHYIARWRGILSSPLPPEATRVAVFDDSGAAVAFVVVGPSRPDAVIEPARPRELWALYVAREHQGTGLARALVDHALGDEPAELWVFDGNPRAEAFYRRLGFERDGVEAPHEDTGLPGIRMVR